MKHLLTIVLLSVFMCAEVAAQENSAVRYITTADGQMVAVPERCILEEKEENGVCVLLLEGGQEFSYLVAGASVTDTYQGELPSLLSFAFTHDDNDQVYKDVEAVVEDAGDTIFVTAEVPVIGKRLRPSFTLSEGASLWVDNVQQVSGQSSHRFEKPLTYTLALPGQWIYDATVVASEPVPPVIEDDGKWEYSKIDISNAATTNAPSNHWSSQDFSNIYDDDINTYFHSTWGSGVYTKLNWVDDGYYGDGVTEWPYVDIELAAPLEHFCFSYTTSDQANRFPQGLRVTAKDNNGEWHEIGWLKSGLPQVQLTEYRSPIYELGDEYSAIRIELTKAAYKNYMVISELALFDCSRVDDGGVDTEPDSESPAAVKGFKPYGRPCKVSVKYLTDHATGDYKIPTIYLTFGDGESWNSSQWIGQTLPDGTNTKEEWIDNCTFRLDGAGVWPDIATVEGCQIRGRGNSSWSWNYKSKNPYRIKFPKKKKQSPFNLVNDRQWVFIANKQNGSMTTNSIAQKVAAMVDAEALCHMIPVDLYINGHYRGSYCFTEKIGISGNSVDIDETAGCLLELDSYFDENFKFRDAYYNLPVNVKDPDFGEEDAERVVTFDAIQSLFNGMTSVLYGGGDVATCIDMESWAKFWLVNDLVRNVETYHPKSCYMFNANVVGGDFWKFGPAWDFDWAFGYEESGTYFKSGASEDIYSSRNGSSGFQFFDALRKTKAGKRAYYKEWVNFMAEGRLQELLEYVDDYTSFALASIKHNNDADIYEKNGYDYTSVAEAAKRWLELRANYIYNSLEIFDVEPDVTVPDDCGKPVEALVIVDALHRDFAPAAGEYASVVYARDIEPGKYGTVVLPFAPDEATLANYSFFELAGGGNGYVSFEEVVEPLANTPYLFTLRDGGENVAMTGGWTAVSTVPETVSVNGWEFVGSLSNQAVDASGGNCYAFSSARGEVNRITNKLTVLPYRAYFKATDASKSAFKVYISGTTGVVEVPACDVEGLGDDAVYDVYGRRVTEPVKGAVYIRNGKKVVF